MRILTLEIKKLKEANLSRNRCKLHSLKHKLESLKRLLYWRSHLALIGSPLWYETKQQYVECKEEYNKLVQMLY